MNYYLISLQEDDVNNDLDYFFLITKRKRKIIMKSSHWQGPFNLSSCWKVALKHISIRVHLIRAVLDVNETPSRDFLERKKEGWLA